MRDNNNNDTLLLVRHLSVDKRTDGRCKYKMIENFVVFNK